MKAFLVAEETKDKQSIKERTKFMMKLGIDIGSVSVKTALLDDEGQVVEDHYLRHKGQSISVLAQQIKNILQRVKPSEIKTCGITGTGGKIVAEFLSVPFINEVIAAACAAEQILPNITTIIEIGGEDSKLISLSYDNGKPTISDFSMNTICAAGTGSFLDQQALRMNLSIKEFAELSLKSKHPPRIAGRCSVFAKTDMIHLQQEATPVSDIIAGLCFAFARNFNSVIGRGKKIIPPVSFQGGVAANKGMVRAFKEMLGLDEGLVVSKHFSTMGAIGAAMLGKEVSDITQIFDLKVEKEETACLEPLSLIGKEEDYTNKKKMYSLSNNRKKKVWIGIDIGSISTNVVAIDEEKRVVARRYLMTASRPIEAVVQGLSEIGEEIGEVVVAGCGTTGSGRYMIGDFAGADIVKNEITAQARAAAEIDPNVDTIFEIGGQDSKYISIENKAIVDFEMNKVCAAGTGSFLEEQAEKLGLSIKEEFANSAFSSKRPVPLGERCTVFMETDLIHHQQAGAERCNLIAGLAYSIVHNYLNRVVGEKRIGKRIFFQGGVANNKAVVAAFEKVVGQKITVPENYDVTGAIGVAIIAKETTSEKSNFKGFDLKNHKYTLSSFECKKCPNCCEIKKVRLEKEEPLFYGARCERFEVKRKKKGEGLPDLFNFKEELLCNIYNKEVESERKIGIPRILFFYEFYPFYKALFSELGFEVVFSEATNKWFIHKGVENVSVDICFPMKLAGGHILSFLERDVDYLFLPSIISLKKESVGFSDSYLCPYIQSIPYTVSSMIDLASVKVLSPIIRMKYGRRATEKAFFEIKDLLGVSCSDIKRAVKIAEEVQAEFRRKTREKGREVLSNLKDKAVVIISRSYNGQDPGLNLELPKKLKDMGALAIPMDFLPLDSVKIVEEWPNMYWRSGQQILAASEIVQKDPRLFAIYLTNYGCGPDSFISTFFKEKMGKKPYLIIEVDEHSADVGAITRCEAFLDSIEYCKKKQIAETKRIKTVSIKKGEGRKLYIPYMSDHAYALSAAFVACGVEAEVMPPSDEETLYWGRKYTSGKECYPTIVTTGDMVKQAKRSDFDPKTSAFFMGGSSGPCRFGQYSMLQRLVLNKIGHHNLPIYAPNQAKDFFRDLNIIGKEFERLAWQGIVCCDILEKCLREIRPYETKEDETEKVYQICLKKVCETIEKRGNLVPIMREARDAFSQILVKKKHRPIIGLVGEFFVRSNAFSNEDVVKRLEELGAEVWAAPVNEWFLYRNFRRNMHAILDRDWGSFIRTNIKNWVQVRDERRFSVPFHHFLRGIEEPSTKELLEWAAPYIHHSFDGEAIMSVGKVVDFAKKGVCGIINTIPFTCMPGTIAMAVLKRTTEDYGGLPCITIPYDGLSQTNTQMRLEAFVYQARQFKRE